VIDSVRDLDRLIRQSRRACRIYLAYTMSLALFGAIMAVVGLFLSAEESSTELMLRVGGGFIAALGTFPLKEFLGRWDRLEELRDQRADWQRDASV
jgi:hypothetical protein